MPKPGLVKRKYGTVSLPLPLIEKIRELIKGTGFTSVSSFVEYVMREILAESSEPDTEEKRRVKERLRALGYLD